MQIVTELCYTDMEKYLASDRDKKQVSLSRRMQMARDAALGVNWLHSKCRIVHLDLKSANLLLDNNLRVKVTDFGFSQIKDTLSADKAKKGTRM
jgi:serine/threonine protein kinase